ncbi:MAG TPA: sulfur transferase domain-containing protein [Abditibacterium sp.]|jgi:uncharacterized protein (TIGR01244 family)
MQNEQQISEKITIGGRPDTAQLEDLKSRGFRTVVNLMTPDEPNYAGEELAVENLGLSYYAIPISPPLLDDIAVAQFTSAIVSSDGPVAVHCKGGGRAGVLTLLHLAIENGWTLEHTLDEAEKMGAKIGPDSPYRAFFEDYIRRHSAGERI